MILITSSFLNPAEEEEYWDEYYDDDLGGIDKEGEEEEMEYDEEY